MTLSLSGWNFGQRRRRRANHIPSPVVCPLLNKIFLRKCPLFFFLVACAMVLRKRMFSEVENAPFWLSFIASPSPPDIDSLTHSLTQLHSQPHSPCTRHDSRLPHLAPITAPTPLTVSTHLASLSTPLLTTPIHLPNPPGAPR